MSLVSGTLPNLIQGVSQQPASLRLASQAEEQVNGYSSVVEGLGKRPPTRHVKKLKATPTSGVFLHTINRDLSERYVVEFANQSVRVFDLDGTEISVSYEGASAAYLTTLAPGSDLGAVTVADYTFVLNRAVKVEEDPASLIPTRPAEAMVWVKQGGAAIKYRIIVNGSAVQFETSGGTAATDLATQKTDAIATNLASQLVTLLGATFMVKREGSTIYLKRVDGAEFNIEVEDGFGDQALALVKHTVQRFTDLPAKAFAGFIVRIRGSSESAFDDYWLVYDPAPGNPNGAIWRETAKPGEISGFKATTMPHVLVRNADGTFTFKAQIWTARDAGDSESIPMPSFVGRKINDIFFHRNRLGFIADENVVFSRAGEFFKFFTASSIQTVDTDPIDVAASHTKVSILRHAIAFNKSLLLFSDQTQFVLGQAETLTPRTVSIEQTTEFECSLKAKPVGAGKNVYFAANRGGFTALREYYVDASAETTDAADVTAHVPKYVPSNVTKLAASSNEDVLFALSSDKRNVLYVYRYHWSGQEKLQSAWSPWEFPAGDTILNVDIIESTLWLVVSRADGTYLESVGLEPGAVTAPAPFQAHLDRLVTDAQCPFVWNAGTGETTITLPYAPTIGDVHQLILWFNGVSGPPGAAIPFTTVGSTLTVPGQVTKFIFGRSYTFRHKLSTLQIKEEATGGGQQSVNQGRLQIRRVLLKYARSGYFKTIVTPNFRTPFQRVFAGRVLGSGSNILGAVAIEDEGTFTFPVMSRNTQVSIEITSDSFLPCRLLSAEWEGDYTARSRRIG